MLKEPQTFTPINFCDGAKASKDFGVSPGEMVSVGLTALCSERCGFCIAKEDEDKLLFRKERPEEFAWDNTGVVYEDGHDSFYWEKFRE